MLFLGELNIFIVFIKKSNGSNLYFEGWNMMRNYYLKSKLFKWNYKMFLLRKKLIYTFHNQNLEVIE